MTITPDAPARKLREATFFLSHMKAREGDSRLDRHEEFGFFLSAFLNAAYSVQEVLRKKYQSGWQREAQSWRAGLETDLRTLVAALQEERRITVHRGHNATAPGSVQVPALHHYASRSPPWAYDECASVEVTNYSLELEGRLVPAIDVCEQYIAALQTLASRCMAYQLR